MSVVRTSRLRLADIGFWFIVKFEEVGLKPGFYFNDAVSEDTVSGKRDGFGGSWRECQRQSSEISNIKCITVILCVLIVVKSVLVILLQFLCPLTHRH